MPSEKKLKMLSPTSSKIKNLNSFFILGDFVTDDIILWLVYSNCK